MEVRMLHATFASSSAELISDGWKVVRIDPRLRALVNLNEAIPSLLPKDGETGAHC